MPDCPNCHGFYFGNPDTCPKCYYNFKRRRVETPEVLADRKKWEEERKAAELERVKKEREAHALMLSKNPRYEYTTVFIEDDRNGSIDRVQLNETLIRYASDGWRLHTIFTNESGKNATSAGVGGVALGTNATLETTILVFERCIKAAEY